MTASLNHRAGAALAAPPCAATLTLVMYHYVRDLPRSRFPRIKGLELDAFRRQLAHLREQYELASLESALAFLAGEYQPRRNLCLLTFDDGLREHFAEVTPLLAEARAQGLFFVVTRCLEESFVAAVHKNHFLMASVPLAEYRAAVLRELAELAPAVATAVDPALARQTYRWDEPDAAEFKFLLNFRLDEALRDRVLDRLFARFLGDEAAFARELYFNWEEARQMQAAGMILGGHSHRHQSLATLPVAEQQADLRRCCDLLHARLSPQAVWPFSYPYGKPGSAYTPATVEALRQLGFCCGLSTLVGTNSAGEDLFSLRRLDTKDLPA